MINSPPSAQLRVLVVDDYPDLADTLTFLIQLSGHEARAAYGGRQALEIAPTFKPHLIFLDINMPDMDGYAVARALRRSYQGHLYLIAHTANSGHRFLHDLQVAGFDQIMRKPADETMIQNVLREQRQLMHAQLN